MQLVLSNQTELETHKANLKRNADADLEDLKARSTAALETLKAQFNAELETSKAELKAQVDAALEVQKAALQRVSHIDRSQFDMEFSSSQKLWSSVCALVDKTVRVLNQHDYTELDPEGGEKRKVADEADKEYFSTNAIVHEVRPFISDEIDRIARSLVVACKPEVDFLYIAIEHEQSKEPTYNQEEVRREAHKTRQNITTQWEMLADSIRGRLSSVIVER
jgi:hypothetical protein